MKIAFDFDDTISDRESAIKKYSYEKYFFERKKEGIFLTRPSDGIVELIKNLSKNHELGIITATFKERIHWIKEWLDSNSLGEDFSSIYQSNKELGLPKEKVCSIYGFDVLIDNEERHFDLSNKNLLRILFKEDKNKNYNYYKTKNPKEIERIIEHYKN